jgi:hypothetical protein
MRSPKVDLRCRRCLGHQLGCSCAGGRNPDDPTSHFATICKPSELFEQGEVDINPDDDKLAAQLGSIKWGIDSRGRIKIESKDDMRKKGNAVTR